VKVAAKIVVTQLASNPVTCASITTVTNVTTTNRALVAFVMVQQLTVL